MPSCGVELLEIRPLTGDGPDRIWAKRTLLEVWGEAGVARRGELLDPTVLPGFAATLQGEWAGLVTYRIEDDECEIVTLNSLVEHRGVGQALIAAVRRLAERAGCTRLWLVTTNNNIRALDLYQRSGFDLVALRRHAVDQARRTLKPGLPERDHRGVPIAHELELEMTLAPGARST